MAGSLFAQAESPLDSDAQVVVTPTFTPTPSKTSFEGHFGLGFSSVSVSPAYAQSGSADSVYLFDIRYWLSDGFILEALVGGTAGTQLGSDANNNPYDDPYWAYSYGLGVKSNLSEPVPGLLIQTITRLLYLQNSSQKSSNTTVYQDQYDYLSLSAGLGFEYFMPFAKNLSVETSVTLEFDENWESYTATPRNVNSSSTVYSPSTWVFKVNSPGFNLTSISIHYYF